MFENVLSVKYIIVSEFRMIVRCVIASSVSKWIAVVLFLFFCSRLLASVSELVLF